MPPIFLCSSVSQVDRCDLCTGAESVCVRGSVVVHDIEPHPAGGNLVGKLFLGCSKSTADGAKHSVSALHRAVAVLAAQHFAPEQHCAGVPVRGGVFGGNYGPRRRAAAQWFWPWRLWPSLIAGACAAGESAGCHVAASAGGTRLSWLPSRGRQGFVSKLRGAAAAAADAAAAHSRQHRAASGRNAAAATAGACGVYWRGTAAQQRASAPRGRPSATRVPLCGRLDPRRQPWRPWRAATDRRPTAAGT